MCISYPASAKQYLALYPGFAQTISTRCRVRGASGEPLGCTPFAEHHRLAFEGMMAVQRELSASVGAAEINPATGKPL